MPHKWCCKNKRDYSFQDSSGFGIERKIPLHFIICYYLEKYHGKESSDSSSLEILWQFPILFKRQQTPRSLFFLFVTRSENLWRPFGEEFLLDPFVCTLRPRRRQLSSLERTRRPFSYFWGVRPIALLRLPQILNFFAKWFSSRPLPRWSLQQQPLYERRPTSNDDGA